MILIAFLWIMAHKTQAKSFFKHLRYIIITSETATLRIELLIQFLLKQNRYESKRAGQYVCHTIDLSWLHQAGLIVNHFTRHPKEIYLERSITLM